MKEKKNKARVCPVCQIEFLVAMTCPVHEVELIEPSVTVQKRRAWPVVLGIGAGIFLLELTVALFILNKLTPALFHLDPARLRKHYHDVFTVADREQLARDRQARLSPNEISRQRGLAMLGTVPSQTNALLVEGAPGKNRPIQIPLNSPRELDGLSKDAVLELRRQAVAQHPELLARPYSTEDEVFSLMQSGLPWWGMTGHSYYGQGAHSVDGPTLESLYIANPFLLICPQWGVSRSAVDSARVGAYSQYPLEFLPESLIWDSKNRTFDLTYDLAKYRAASLNAAKRHGFSQDYLRERFVLNQLNARDFGYNWMHVTLEGRNGLYEMMPNAEMMTQRIGLSGSCGFHCNHVVCPSYQDHRPFRLTYPAVARIKLWKEQPSTPLVKADVTCLIHFNDGQAKYEPRSTNDR